MNKKLHCDLNIGDILIFILKWVLITIVTLGIGGMFYTFSIAKRVVNSSYLVDDNGQRVALKSNLNVGDDLLFIIIWTLIIFFTAGIGSLFYIFYFIKYVVNKTEVIG